MTPAAVAPALLAAWLAAPLAIHPREAKPGDAILLDVAAPGDAAPSATVAGRSVRFWRSGDGWRAVAGLPVEAAPGPLRVGGRAGPEEFEGTVTVVDPAFRSRELTVPPKFVRPPPSVRERIAADRRAFDAAFSRPFAPPLFTAPFDWPLVAETSGRYGDRRLFNGKQEGQHYGLDLDAAPGTPIRAANAGEVVMVRDNYYAGLTVLVWHGADLYSAYFHLSSAAVKVGQALARGDELGRSGATGRATGPHLHWGMKVAGRWVDPESVLRLGSFAREEAPPRAP